MDPFSAIRSVLPPGAAQAMQGAMEAGMKSGAGAIPEAELRNLNVGGPSGVAKAADGAGFESLLGNLVRDVTAKQAQSASMVNAMLAGENVPLHKAMIASEEASLSFTLMVEVRNKLLESYQELMRMQV